MAGDDFDRVEVDHLIRELSSPAPKPKVKAAAPVAAKPADAPAAPLMAAVAAAVAPAARPVTQLPRLPLPVRRTLADRLAADAMPRPDRWQKLRDVGDRIRLPFHRLPQIRLPEMPRGIGVPDQITAVRLWVGLAVALAVAMPFWPYPKTNAWWVVFYMFAVVMVVVAGIWSARLTWATRLGIAHIVALAIVLWGITLAAEETLPLMGYANIDAASICEAPPGSRG